MEFNSKPQAPVTVSRQWQQVVVSLPSMSETQIEFLAPGSGPGPTQIVSDIWGPNQQIGKCLVSPFFFFAYKINDFFKLGESNNFSLIPNVYLFYK